MGENLVNKNKAVEVELVMSKEKATMLTEDIKSTTTALYALLKQAHDEKAFIAMGYKTWTEYVEKEFDFSRARSYQLINQANVIEQIEESSGFPIYITERDARAIKKRLPEITEKLKAEVKEADLEREEAERVAKEILENREPQEEMKDLYEENEIDNSNLPMTPPSEEKQEEYCPINNKGLEKYNLNEDEKFYYDNLLITLKIFKDLPDPVEFGQIISKSTENKKELSKLAEYAFSWITRLIDEVQ